MLSPLPITADSLLRLQRPIVSTGARKIPMLLEVLAGEGPALWMGISMLLEVLAGEGLALWREGLD